MANHIFHERDTPPIGKRWAYNFVKRWIELYNEKITRSQRLSIFVLSVIRTALYLMLAIVDQLTKGIIAVMYEVASLVPSSLRYRRHQPSAKDKRDTRV